MAWNPERNLQRKPISNHFYIRTYAQKARFSSHTLYTEQNFTLDENKFRQFRNKNVI